MAGFAFWGLIFMVALAPLPFGSNRPAPWSALAAATGLFLVVWSIASLRRQGSQLPWSRHWPVTVGFLLVSAWLYLQAMPWSPASWHHPLWTDAAAALNEPLAGAISMSPAQTMTALMRFVTYGGVFWLAMQFGQSRRRSRIALWTIVLAGVAYASYGIAVELFGSESILWYKKWAYLGSLTSTFVNRNTLATYVGMSLIAAQALMLSNLRRSVQLPKDSIADSIERNVRAAGPLFIVILVLASALLLSHSRGGLLATLVGITVLFSAETVRHGRSNRTRRLVVITVAVLLLLITIGGGSTLQRMMVDDSQEAAGGRAEIYWQTVAGIEGQPWTGAGYGTFETAFSFWGGADDINLGRVDKAHNTYLEFAAEAGLPAFLVMLAILLWINGCCLRSVLLQRRDTILQAVALAVSAQLAAHSFVDFSLQIPAIAVSYALLLGAGFAQSWSDQTAEAAPRIG